MSIADMVQKMIDDLNETMADAVKSDKGNNAAMTRVRKAMQAAKRRCTRRAHADQQHQEWMIRHSN